MPDSPDSEIIMIALIKVSKEEGSWKENMKTEQTNVNTQVTYNKCTSDEGRSNTAASFSKTLEEIPLHAISASYLPSILYLLIN